MAYSREIEKLERQFAENPRRFAAPFADALRKNEDVERALEVIRVGLELNPDYIPGSVILGRCHLDLGDDNGAEAAFSRVLDLDNENVIALKSLADIMERQGRNHEAISFLTYLLDVDRSNDEAREQLTRIQGLPAAGAAPRARAPDAAEDAAVEAGAVFGAPPGDLPSDTPPPVEQFLEPTALWEPPATVSEAPMSSWVEPTSSATFEPPEFGESLVEEPPTVDEVAPVEGFEAVELADGSEAEAFGEFVLEREEEIVLTSSSGAEYQVANDSEALLEHTLSSPVEEKAKEEPEQLAPTEAEPPAPEPPGAGAWADVGDSGSETADELAREAAGGSAPAGDADRDDVSPAAAGEEETPLEWAMHVAEEREFHPAEATHGGGHASDSYDAAIEGIAPVDEEDEAEADEAEAEPGVEAPVLMVTESMAELYAGQGHPSEALGVYRILYDRNPDNERLRLRIQELESVLAARVLEDAAPSYAASVTGGKGVATFLGDMLNARPAPVDLPEPPKAPEPPVAATGAESGEEEAVASGAPTRPAIDRLSLGAIFGEDASPVPPAENAAAAEQAESGAGFSFDEFFGGGEGVPSGRTSSGSVRASRASDDEDDLDQFHSWLQSLKR